MERPAAKRGGDELGFVAARKAIEADARFHGRSCVRERRRIGRARRAIVKRAVAIANDRAAPRRAASPSLRERALADLSVSPMIRACESRSFV
jgi:hypothetical protein